MLMPEKENTIELPDAMTLMKILALACQKRSSRSAICTIDK